MTLLNGNLARFLHNMQETLQGTIEIHVYDPIGMGTEKFAETGKLTKLCFESKPRKYYNMIFAGITITKYGKNYLLRQSL